MSEETTIAPALTPEEWKGQASAGCPPRYIPRDIQPPAIDRRVAWGASVQPDGTLEVGHGRISGAERHGLAALALHEQPFGFTQEDVTRLLDAALNLRAYARSESGRELMADDRSFVSYGEKWLNEIAAKIASLLAPVTP